MLQVCIALTHHTAPLSLAAAPVVPAWVFGRSVSQDCDKEVQVHRTSCSSNCNEIGEQVILEDVFPVLTASPHLDTLYFGLTSVFDALWEFQHFRGLVQFKYPHCWNQHINPKQSSNSMKAQIENNPLHPFSQSHLHQKAYFQFEIWNMWVSLLQMLALIKRKVLLSGLFRLGKAKFLSPTLHP